MKLLRGLVTAALLLGATAALAADAAPKWVDGSSVMYPREKYLVGVGTADDRASAESRAKASIASVFSTEVSSTTTVQASERSGGGTSEYSQSISQDVQTATRKVLEGVEIAEQWFNKATGQHFALAILNRAKATVAIRGKLDEIEAAARHLQKRMGEGESRFERARDGMRLLALVRKRDQLQADLRVVSPGAKAESTVDFETATSQATKAVSELIIVVAVEGAEASKSVGSGAVRALNELGFRATAAAGVEPDIEVRVAVQIDEPKRQGQWQWARATAAVSLVEARSSQVFLQFEASGREASADYGEALKRSTASLARKLATDVRDGLSKYLETR